MSAIITKLLKLVSRCFGYELVGVKKVKGRALCLSIPDFKFYQPYFSPWLGFGEFAGYYDNIEFLTLSSKERCFNLYQLALHAINLDGEIWECGVYRGGTANLLTQLIEKKCLNKKKLRLFDTFEGMPETSAKKDIRHKKGDYNDTSLEIVKINVGEAHFIEWYKGFIPHTFEGLETKKIAFAHIDVDIYQSIKDCCEYIYPRLTAGGIILFDDYGLPSCPGAREATDDFFKDKPENLIVLPSGQAFLVAHGQ